MLFGVSSHPDRRHQRPAVGVGLLSMRAHRQLHQRLARIECQQSRLPDDPESLRHAMIRTVQKTRPLDEATAFVNDLLAMPYPDARALLMAEIERREAL